MDDLRPKLRTLIEQLEADAKTHEDTAKELATMVQAYDQSHVHSIKARVKRNDARQLRALLWEG